MLAYPIAMGLAIVYCAEHYVIDVLLGWAYAAAVMLACGAWERQRDRAPAATCGARQEAAESSSDADPDVVGASGLRPAGPHGQLLGACPAARARPEQPDAEEVVRRDCGTPSHHEHGQQCRQNQRVLRSKAASLVDSQHDVFHVNVPPRTNLAYYGGSVREPGAEAPILCGSAPVAPVAAV